MYRLVRPLLFRLSPEKAHRLTVYLLKWFIRSAWAQQRRARYANQPITLWGLTFPNRVGVAAGFDKDGECIDALLGLGFGFVEVGTVTPKPQTGNPKPRLFRLTQAQALINRMGFNNRGVDYLVSQLQKRRCPGIVGVNIGKNLTTPLEQAAQDYQKCLAKVYPYADFITINVSSPNTPGLRKLQTRDYLNNLLQVVAKEKEKLIKQYNKQVPLLLKITVDLDANSIESAVDLALTYHIDGLICSNTTLSRDGIEQLPDAKEAGGLSGPPLFGKMLQTLQQLSKLAAGRLPIIAVGGIASTEDAQACIRAGAALVQVYTGLVYHGPALLKQLAKIG